MCLNLTLILAFTKPFVYIPLFLQTKNMLLKTTFGPTEPLSRQVTTFLGVLMHKEDLLRFGELTLKISTLKDGWMRKVVCVVNQPVNGLLSMPALEFVWVSLTSSSMIRIVHSTHTNFIYRTKLGHP